MFLRSCVFLMIFHPNRLAEKSPNPKRSGETPLVAFCSECFYHQSRPHRFNHPFISKETSNGELCPVADPLRPRPRVRQTGATSLTS